MILADLIEKGFYDGVHLKGLSGKEGELLSSVMIHQLIAWVNCPSFWLHHTVFISGKIVEQEKGALNKIENDLLDYWTKHKMSSVLFVPDKTKK